MELSDDYEIGSEDDVPVEAKEKSTENVTLLGKRKRAE